MIKRISSLALIKKATNSRTAKKCVVGLGFIGLTNGTAQISNKIDTTFNISNKTRTSPRSARKVINWKTAQDTIANINKSTILKKIENAQKSIILKIMKEDPNCNAGANSSKIAENIVKIAEEYGADPIHIACIAKTETHFTENITSKNGQGMMQITKTCLKDMYLRPNFYHSKLKNITSKYKNPDELYQAVKNKPILNLRIGTMLYLALLKQAKGNIKQALIYYNGSQNKYVYANKVYSDIIKYQNKIIANQKYIAHK